MTRRPLVDLHRHLEGSLRPSTVLEIARETGHAYAGLTRPRDELVVTGPVDGLLGYLDKVDRWAGVLSAAEHWHRAAREAVADAYDEGLDHLELRYSPWFVASQTGLPPEEVVDAVTAGVASAAQADRLPVGLIGILLRDLGPDAADRQLDTVLSRRQSFCAVDLAGNEAGFAAELFAPAFARARDAGLHVTVHAGEAAGPHSVRAALEHLGAERIGHGVRAAEDPELLELLARRGTTVEVALTSNVQTGAAPSYRQHQVHALLAAGVAVTLNTDDPTASDTTLAREHLLARLEVGLCERQLDALADASLSALFSAGPEPDHRGRARAEESEGLAGDDRAAAAT